MQYHGIVLSTTFLFQPGGSVGKDGYRPRYSYVSDENGIPVESVGRSRWGTLQSWRNGADGWKVIGTWPVGRHPAGVWKDARWKGGDAA